MLKGRELWLSSISMLKYLWTFIRGQAEIALGRNVHQASRPPLTVESLYSVVPKKVRS